MVDGPYVTVLKSIFPTRQNTVINRPVRWETKALKPSEWHICATCSGDGWYESAGDLHRSAGIVPCTYCDHGTVKRVSRPVYRVKAGSNKT